MARMISAPQPEHVCSGCGANLQVWPYAFALAQRRVRLKYFGPDGYLRRHGQRAWKFYVIEQAELRARWNALAAMGVRTERFHGCA